VGPAVFLTPDEEDDEINAFSLLDLEYGFASLFWPGAVDGTIDKDDVDRHQTSVDKKNDST
jgi:hypothetical protein